MANYDSNYAIAQLISARLGNEPIPFDSVYSICLLIYQELGGVEQNFDSVYSILLEILPLVDGGISSKVIDDSVISLSKTWSSSKISSELADAGFKTEFVEELPATGDIHTIYFVPSSSALAGNVYDEFMWNASASEWEQVGSTAIDLTDIINDASVLSNRTWSSEKINSELEALAGDANSEIVAAETIDVTFVNAVPVEAGEDGQYVIYTTEVEDTLYKYENNSWDVQIIDANKLYFDTENNLLYAYKSATHKFAEVAVDNTIIFSGSMTSNAAKTALNPIKTPGVYNVLQHSKSGSKTTMTNWVMTVTFLDSNEADELDGSVYQKLENNYTVYKRYYKPKTDTWTSMTKYYEGLVRDALTSSAYYSWSVNKIKTELSTKQNVLNASNGIAIDASNNISLEGLQITNDPSTYKYNFATYYYDDDTNQLGVNTANGDYSNWAEGSKTTATSRYGGNHAEGYGSSATGEYAAHSEGAFNVASNQSTHAEGEHTLASGKAAHSEGFGANNNPNTASGIGSHTEGCYTNATGYGAHAEGYGAAAYKNVASGDGSHTEGIMAISLNAAEHAEGYGNLSHSVDATQNGFGNAGNTIHSIGISKNPSARANALEVMQNADLYIKGLGGYQGTDTKVQNASIMTVQEVINSKADAYEVATNAEVDMLFVQLTTIE